MKLKMKLKTFAKVGIFVAAIAAAPPAVASFASVLKMILNGRMKAENKMFINVKQFQIIRVFKLAIFQFNKKPITRLFEITNI